MCRPLADWQSWRHSARATISAVKLPILPIHRRDGDRHDDQVQEQEEVAGVTASWHDRGAAKKWTARKLPAPLPTKRTPRGDGGREHRQRIAAMLRWTVSTVPACSISNRR